MNNHTTKQKILEASIRLFNWSDVANVRLQQIADETGISVGNLAYHYKNKEAIVTAVYENLFEEFSNILSSYLMNPKLSDFDHQITQYHRFFAKYKFYVIDLFEVERTYPHIMERWREYVNKMMLQIRKRLDYNVARGILQPESAPGVYNTLANNIWMTIVFWIPQRVLQDKPLEEVYFKQAVWAHVTPFFTPQGIHEFTLDIQPNMVS
jgi:AcrR family transcriptional regulator